MEFRVLSLAVLYRFNRNSNTQTWINSKVGLAARGESTIGRVPSAAGADARRRDAGDTRISSRSANAADAPAPPEPFGRIGIAGNLCVARRQRCPRIASSSRLDLARNTYARGLLYFHHGLLDLLRNSRQLRRAMRTARSRDRYCRRAVWAFFCRRRWGLRLAF